jgi:hypothetical protein
MKTFLLNKTAVVLLLSLVGSNTYGLPWGWHGARHQTDPFDTNSVKLSMISKENFTLNCNTLSMDVAHSYTSYSSHSFRAEVQYIVNSEGASIVKSGTYSSGLYGWDIVTDRRYYSFTLTTIDLELLKNAQTLTVAGRYGNNGSWETKTLNLSGFVEAYNELKCN